MSASRRTVLTGLTTLPFIGSVVALAGTTDPFPGYHAEITALQATIDAGADDATADALMSRWAEIDGLAQSTRPTTLPGAIACLEYTRREHVQFAMLDDEAGGDPADRLILSLLDGALGVLRQMTP